MGKRKIVIEKIPDRQRRSVTFTKRRDGLFKKAETACQKFGLQIGIVVFSPAGKPFTFCNSSSVSVDAIIDTYMSSNSSSSTMVMGKRSRSDGDEQVIETEKKKKKKKKKKKRKIVMNDAAVVTPPACITVQEEEEEKLDQGFHYKNLDSAQIYDDQELTNELMDYGENEGIVTGEMINMESSQQFLVQGETYSWAPPDVELQEIINVEDDFEYDDHCAETTTMGLIPPPHHTTTTSTSLCDLTSASDMNEEEVGGADKDVELQEIVNLEYADHHPHHDETAMGLLPPSHTHITTTTTTTTSLCNSMSASDMNEEEVGGSNEDDYGYTLEEWEHILSTSPTSVVDSGVGNSTSSSSYMNQEVVQAHWPSQEFLQLLCS